LKDITCEEAADCRQEEANLRNPPDGFVEAHRVTKSLEGCMSDDLKKRGAQDRRRKNVNEPREVKDATKELVITEEQLQELVRKQSADKVRQALAQNKAATRAHSTK